jgi:hypothetical protein
MAYSPQLKPMTFNDTLVLEKGDVAYVAIQAIEAHLKELGFQLADDSDCAINDALWDALAHITVSPTR